MSASAFDRILLDVARVDARLADSMGQLERSWSSGDARDRELTEHVATALLRAVEQGLFSIQTMVEGFNTFAHDFHERQVDFLRSGQYRARDYAEVSRDVYSNEAFMGTTYYPALVLSYLAAPNYRHILRRLDTVLSSWREAGVARVLDVGSGHAFLLLFALSRLPEATGIGTDIAPAAGLFAPRLQAATGWAPDRFRCVVADVLEDPHGDLRGPFDAAICCELLEHVPAPELFLRAIHRRLRPGGRLFLSAAVRMESVDHLTLFGSTGEVADLLQTEGFAVAEEMSLPFVTRPPRDARHRQKLLADPLVAATFLAECRKA